MLTATTPAISAYVAPFTVGELRELELPPALAIKLSMKPVSTQVRVLRKFAGFPFRRSVAMGLTIRIDGSCTVLSIDRDR